jgi:hypothetical protein
MLIDFQPLSYAYLQFIATFGADGFQYCLTVALLGITLFQTLRPRGRLASAPAFCGVLLLSLFAIRLPTLFPTLYNPDEAQMVAGARRLFVDPVFWRSVDGTTGGPLLYYALALLRLAGLPLNFATARIANLLCVWGMIVFLYMAARLLMPEWAARMSILPLHLAAMQIRFHEFLQYSSESLPNALIALSVWLSFRCYAADRAKYPGKPRWWFLLGVSLALFPIAKLQATPMAAFLGAAAVAIWLKRDSRQWQSAGWLLAGGASVLAALIVLFACFGLYGDFYQSYWINNLLYARQPELAWTPALLLKFFFLTEDMRRILVWPVVFIVLVVLHQAWQRKWRPSPAGILAMGLFLASLYAIMQPGRPFHHYLLFLLVPVFLGVVAAFRAELSSGFRPAVLGAVFLFVTVVVPVFQQSDAEAVLTAFAALPEVQTTPEEKRLAEIANPGDLVAVWGWYPELYVLTGTVPATREAQTQRQIEDGPQRAYYRKRFLDDMRRTPPKVFVDAVAPSRPRFRDRDKEGSDAVPELREYLSSQFELAGQVNDVRFYVRRSHQ